MIGTDPAWFAIAGLVFDIVGAVVLALALFLTNAEIDDRAGTIWDENPHIAKALRGDRTKAIIGTALLVFGFLLQAYGQWPRS